MFWIDYSSVESKFLFFGKQLDSDLELLCGECVDFVFEYVGNVYVGRNIIILVVVSSD